MNLRVWLNIEIFTIFFVVIFFFLRMILSMIFGYVSKRLYCPKSRVFNPFLWTLKSFTKASDAFFTKNRVELLGTVKGSLKNIKRENASNFPELKNVWNEIDRL